MTCTVFGVPQKHHLCTAVCPQNLNFPDLHYKTPALFLFSVLVLSARNRFCIFVGGFSRCPLLVMCPQKKKRKEKKRKGRAEARSPSGRAGFQSALKSPRRHHLKS